MRANRLSLTVVAAVAAVVLAGCANDEDNANEAGSGNAASSASATPTDTPTASPTESKEPAASGPVVQVTIAGDSVQPVAEQVKMSVGDTLTLAVESDRDAELHVHSTPEQTVQVTPGVNEYTITFDKPGTVDIEEHASHVLVVRALVS